MRATRDKVTVPAREQVGCLGNHLSPSTVLLLDTSLVRWCSDNNSLLAAVLGLECLEPAERTTNIALEHSNGKQELKH
jgi:hypothetical protein